MVDLFRCCTTSLRKGTCLCRCYTQSGFSSWLSLGWRCSDSHGPWRPKCTDRSMPRGDPCLPTARLPAGRLLRRRRRGKPIRQVADHPLLTGPSVSVRFAHAIWNDQRLRLQRKKSRRGAVPRPVHATVGWLNRMVVSSIAKDRAGRASLSATRSAISWPSGLGRTSSAIAGVEKLPSRKACRLAAGAADRHGR